jgi:hypothetical protein
MNQKALKYKYIQMHSSTFIYIKNIFKYNTNTSNYIINKLK